MSRIFNVLICLFSLLLFCCSNKNTEMLYGYGLEPDIIKTFVKNDTVSKSDYKRYVQKGLMPDVNKMTVNVMKNYEENKAYNFYVYYDKKTNKMYSVKMLLETDTLYIINIKDFK